MKINNLIYNKEYGVDSLSITGPNVCRHFMNTNDIDDLCLANTCSVDDGQYSLIRFERDPIIKNTYHNYYHEGNYQKTEHYGVLWDTKNVFIDTCVVFRSSMIKHIGLINFNELNEKNRTIISYQNIDRVQNGKRY
jgi:hypothetical protein